MNILERFLKYVSIDTTSDSSKEDNPSTNCQRDLALLLVDELNELNLDSVYFDRKHCYVYGKLNGDESLPGIGFVSHLDTSEGAKGNNIRPNIFYDYDGSDITLNGGTVIKPSEYPDLKTHLGKTLITSDGTTLLGADDKAGIAEIIDMLQSISQSTIRHGDIYVCFTPDEEIGLGTLHIDRNYFNPDFAYTVDGSTLGEFSYENFNAATAIININGISTHCGHAKDKMVNAGRIATIINSLLPDELPENTENREGFFHLNEISGNVSKAHMKYLIRDFNSENFNKRKQMLFSIVQQLNKKYNNCIDIEIKDSYQNMFDIVNSNPYLINGTLTAIRDVNVTPLVLPIRGGTDGTEISLSGIPCPNIGTGGHNFHSVYEYICLEDMEKASEILLSIIKQFSKDDVKRKIKE